MDRKPISKQDTLVVIIGFALIIAVSAFFLLKGLSTNPNPSNTPAQDMTRKTALVTIAVTDLRRMLITDTSVIRIVDFRPASDFDAEHAAGSIRLDTPDSLSGVSLPDGGTFVLIPSGNDVTDQAVSKALSDQGKKFVFIADGLTGWQTAGGVIVTQPNLSSPIDRSKVTLVSVADWKKLIATKDIVYRIINTRPTADSTKAPVPGALNIPYADLENRRAEIPVATNIALCAGSGDDAFRAAVRLFDLGSFSVKTLDGNCADIIGK
jgi:rhodanese-related sulfurtransferase